MAENKKDSFTFSDKIKNSKPAVNPFAKKGASKIGNNGKPKQTLFERSRRDAPFMIAAAAALLMLPFLYKYSGTVNDDVIVPPGSEDSIFDPERFGFSPSAEDPTGQIAQLAGRDPLSLIKGWGTPEEEQQAEPDYSYDRDGLEDRDYTPTPRPDTPNYRQTAPAATRAAFQRTPTKIKDLGSASLNLRGGGGVGSRFGGAQLKAAAKQNSAGGPKRGIKPVSLTPLRAAGAPARSYFGQGAAAQARASRDALSKANASEALRDAMFAPVEHGRTGGLGDGFFASGGGLGKIDRNMDFKGLEPWWWDMMKQQEMEKWKYNYFLWRNNLVVPLIQALAKVLAKLGEGLACCILTGEDDCSMGSMWGTDGTTATAAGCEINKQRFSSMDELRAAYPNVAIIGSDLKKWCQNVDPKNFGKVEWKEAKGGGGNLGFFGKRINCLGGTYHGRGSTDLKDRFSCEAIDSTHNFELQATGSANSATWHYYHAVVARNYVPFQPTNGGHGGEGYYLCGAPRNDYNPKDAGGYSNIESGKAPGEGQTQRAADKKGRVTTWSGTDEEGNKKEFDERFLGMNRKTVNDSCVIYIAEGKVFDWDNFKSKSIKLLDDLKLTDPNDDNKPVDGETAFNALQLYFIEGYAMKTTLSSGFSDKVENSDGKKVRVYGMPVGVLPIKYVDFETLYILRRNSSKDTEKFTDSKINTRTFGTTHGGEDYQDGMTRTSLANDGKVTALRTGCKMSNFRITAEVITTPKSITSVLSFNPRVHGSRAEKLKVTVVIKDQNGNTIYSGDGHQIGVNGPSARYEVTEDGVEKVKEALARITSSSESTMTDEEGVTTTSSSAESRNAITAYWTATYTETGETSEDNASYGEYGKITQTKQKDPKTKIPPPPILPPDGSLTRFARFLNDVPSDYQGRKSLDNAQNDKIANSAMSFTFKNSADEATLNKAYITSEAAREYMFDIMDKYNANIPSDSNAPRMNKDAEGAGLSAYYPILPEILDAMYTASKVGRNTIPNNVVCDIARGIAVKSKDVTAPDYDNTFGTFAVYMDYGYLYPNEVLEERGGRDSIDPRFDCIEKRPRSDGSLYYKCDYPWENYINKKNMAPYPGFGRILQEAGINSFPLKDLLLEDKVQRQNDIRAWRMNYYNATKNLFYGVGEGECKAFADDVEMDVSKAIEYVTLVMKNGLNYKPMPYRPSGGHLAGTKVGGKNEGVRGKSVTETGQKG